MRTFALSNRLLVFVLVGVFFFAFSHLVLAFNILEYSDRLSDSGPGEQSNHTLTFILGTNVSSGSIFTFTMPAGFEVVSTSTFAERDVELWVNGAVRISSSTATSGVDKVEILPGLGGSIVYTLAPDLSLNKGDKLEFRIGNNASTALKPSVTYSTSTGTTTTPGDIEPVINAGTLGVHKVNLTVTDAGTKVAETDFVIFLNEKVRIPNVDTTETIPPYRFNPAPTGTISGTTLNVEISLETDEFAWCRYATTTGVDFNAMTNYFSNTGLIFHSQVVSVTPGSVQKFYVRCIDDEGNYNTDDFAIVFTVGETPTGEANTEGDTSGDGSGNGNSGTGNGSGSGGTTGQSSGQEPKSGGSSGSGGSGGGGGGGTGKDSGSTAGGGFESKDDVYPSGDARVIINGFAYPESKVSILVDGKFFDTTTADNTGKYSITLDQIAKGVYTFGVYAEGPDGTKSSTFSTSFTVTGSRTTSLSNINVAPSILVEPDPVNPGETLTISGYALPNATVYIENGKLRSSIIKELTVTSDDKGAWSTTLDTSPFSVATYQVRAKSKQDEGAETNWSEYTYYGVGGDAEVPINADLNRDGKVNLIDFSILLFWWATDGGDSDPPADINRDGTVSLTDFSIMLFNWSG